VIISRVVPPARPPASTHVEFTHRFSDALFPSPGDRSGYVGNTNYRMEAFWRRLLSFPPTRAEKFCARRK
jgi:hypothetical protein